MLFDNVTDDTTTVYVHILSNDTNSKNTISCSYDSIIPFLKKSFKFSIRRFVSFWIDNMEYSYELSNDNQCLFKHSLINHTYLQKHRALINCFQDVKLPVYMFPSIQSISHKEEYDLYEYKINNRVKLCIKNSSVFFIYKHSATCEIDVHIKEIESILQKIEVATSEI